MKSISDVIIFSLFIILLSIALCQYAIIKKTTRTIKQIQICGITLTQTNEGICYFNNGFQLKEHIIDCADRVKIIKKICR